MASPFQGVEPTKSIISFWRADSVELPNYGITLCLKKYPHFRGHFSLVSLHSVYNSSAHCEQSEAALAKFAHELERVAIKHGVNSISVRVGEGDPREKVNPPPGYHWQLQDEFGFADLTNGFDSYLDGRKSGYSEYYRRGLNRDLYQFSVGGPDLPRAQFDAFLERVHRTYVGRGYSFKVDAHRDEMLYACIQNGSALLYSAVARDNPEVYADVYVFLSKDEAYYYLASRSTPVKGVLQGVAHFNQIALVKDLTERGFSRYVLGYVAPLTGLPRSETGVREFKRGLSTAVEPHVLLTRDSLAVRAFQHYVNWRKKFRVS